MLKRLRLYAALVLIATTATVATVTAAPAHAQRPALTKNVDEPGRSPYFSQASGPCDFTICLLNFKAVPAGFRLVVTHASVIFTKSGAGSSTQVILQQTPLTYQDFLSTSSLGGLDYIASSPVMFFVEAGAAPQIEVFRGVANGAAFGTLNGYLVALE